MHFNSRNKRIFSSEIHSKRTMGTSRTIEESERSLQGRFRQDRFPSIISGCKYIIRGYCDDIGICRDLVHEKSLAQGRTDHGVRSYLSYFSLFINYSSKPSENIFKISEWIAHFFNTSIRFSWWLLIVIIVIGILILGVCAALCYYKIPK